MADEKHMPTEMALRLEARGVIAPRAWPRLDQLDKTIRRRGGRLSLEAAADGVTTARVTVLGHEREALADEPNVAVATALADALDAASPQMPLGGGETVDRATGEISPEIVAYARSMQDRSARDGVTMTLTVPSTGKSATIGPTGKAAVDPPDARYDDETGAWHNGNGDVYADGTVVEDTHAELVRA